MARNCGCSGATCGCSVRGDNTTATVTGIGTAADPFVVTATPQDIAGRLFVTDTTSLDLTLLGSGTVADPYIVSGVTKVTATSGGFTPTSAGFTIGSGGSIVGTYYAFGKLTHATMTITLGTGFIIPAEFILSLPSALAESRPKRARIAGGATLDDVSTGDLFSLDIMGSATTTGIMLKAAAAGYGGAAQIVDTWPVPLGAGDIFRVDFDYISS